MIVFHYFYKMMDKLTPELEKRRSKSGVSCSIVVISRSKLFFFLPITTVLALEKKGMRYVTVLVI